MTVDSPVRRIPPLWRQTPDQLVTRRDWFDDLTIRQQVLEALRTAPRGIPEGERPSAPDGMVACPSPFSGHHILTEGHVFTEDGWCWVPAE